MRRTHVRFGGRGGQKPSLPLSRRERRLIVKSPDPLDAYIDAVSKALALPVEEAWKPAVRANLEVSLRLGAAGRLNSRCRTKRARQCLCSLISP